MIYELQPSEFYKVKPLLVGPHVNLEVHAVILGYNPGWVFVDDCEKPQTAMIWNKGIGGVFFLGDARNDAFLEEVNSFIDDHLRPRMKTAGLTSFEFSGTSAQWDKTLPDCFQERKLNISKQYVYKRSSGQSLPSTSAGLPTGYQVVPVTQLLMENTGYDMEIVQESIDCWWGQNDRFYKDGVGFCILHENQAVTSCIISCRTENTIETHIETAEAHRKKGLATAAVSAFVQYAQKNDLNLYWECMEVNYGSRALAEKHGYHKGFEYTLYEFPFE